MREFLNKKRGSNIRAVYDLLNKMNIYHIANTPPISTIEMSW